MVKKITSFSCFVRPEKFYPCGKDSLKAIEKIKNNVMIVDVAEAMLNATGQSGLVLVSLFNLGKS